MAKGKEDKPLQGGKGPYLLSIEEIPSKNSSEGQDRKRRAYFVGSTAPNNVEKGVNYVDSPEDWIKDIAKALSPENPQEAEEAKKQPELLIAIHGYNNAVGTFKSKEGKTGGEGKKKGRGVKGWYHDIGDHIDQHCPERSDKFVLIGYRWPSEQIKGINHESFGNDTLGAKLNYARQSLPVALKVVAAGTIAALVGLTLSALATNWPGSLAFGIIGVITIVAATITLSIVLTLFLLRIAGYFRDSYRATNFGITDLVELLRQIDKAVLEATSQKAESDYWERPENRIKISFIGHSMGGFVVTNTVRILSDLFKKDSVGTLKLSSDAPTDPEKKVSEEKNPDRLVGNVFSLSRLVLVAPDIPAETLILGRANFLKSSLRRFEEAYLFSNEGDMALKLASTAANYASFPARTREGGYRLGNVVVRLPKGPSNPTYGIVNLADLEGRTPAKHFLKYLFILPYTSLFDRQKQVNPLAEEKPQSEETEHIAELFTVFDCTDYYELDKDKPTKRVGMLSHALGKRSLSFLDYVWLTRAYFAGKIDTHGGYFSAADVEGFGSEERPRPEAELTKHLIYGLASLGFESLLESPRFIQLSETTSDACGEGAASETPAAIQKLSQICCDRQIQVLLAPKRYRECTAEQGGNKEYSA